MRHARDWNTHDNHRIGAVREARTKSLETWMKKRSRVTHPKAVSVPSDNRALIAPIYQTAKFTFDDAGETAKFWAKRREGFYYLRQSNPTLRQLEQLLAELQGRDACILTGSGMAAIVLPLLALLKAGDHVVYFAEMYQPTRAFISGMLQRFGITSAMLSIDDLGGLERELSTHPTRMVIFESPTNPVLKVADIARITKLARAYGALTLLDNTLAGVHNHGQFDIDIFLHSLTKFVSGHGDVMGGAVIASEGLIDSMRSDAMLLGASLDPHAAYLMQRGMRSYYLRWDAHCYNAQRVAEHLAGDARVERVRYPGLSSDPGHRLAAQQMDGYGSVVTFDIAGGLEAGSRFAEALELFSIASSLGSTESLVIPPLLHQPRGFSDEQKAWSDIGAGTVRLSVGVEDIEDLLADIDQALERSH